MCATGTEEQNSERMKIDFFRFVSFAVPWIVLCACAVGGVGHCIHISAYKSRTGFTTELLELHLFEKRAVGKSKLFFFRKTLFSSFQATLGKNFLAEIFDFPASPMSVK